MADLLARCDWPRLAAPYDAALRDAVAYLVREVEPLGIVAAGTIVGGAPDATSDLDLYVIHRQPWRQRVQRFFRGVPVEMFINPPERIRGYFRDERAARRPCTAHMLATGHVVLDADPVVEALRQEARVALADPPPASEGEITLARYMAATLLEDAGDLVSRNPADARRLLYRAVDAMLRVPFIRAGAYLPREKDLLPALADCWPEVGDLARRFYLSTDPAEQRDLAAALADRTLGARGFFEWETPRG